MQDFPSGFDEALHTHSLKKNAPGKFGLAKALVVECRSFPLSKPFFGEQKNTSRHQQEVSSHIPQTWGMCNFITIP